MKKIKLLLTGMLMLSLVGCASGIKHNKALVNYQYKGQKFSSVKVTMSDEAKEIHKDNIKFDPVRFNQTLSRTFETNGLIDKNSKNEVNIIVNDIRVRSTAAAVIFGIFAGTDSIDGKVKAVVKQGSTIPEFEVSVSYGLGGYGGGQDDARLAWMYEEFSKVTVTQILGGQPDEKLASTAE